LFKIGIQITPTYCAMNSRHHTFGIQSLRTLWGSFEYKFSLIAYDSIMIYEVTVITADMKASKWYCLFR